MPDILTSIVNVTLLLIYIYIVIIAFYTSILLIKIISRFFPSINNYRMHIDLVISTVVIIIIFVLGCQTEAGIYTGLKDGVIGLFVLLFFVISFIKIMRYYRLRRRQYLRAIVFTTIIFLLFVISINIWFGVYYRLEDHQPSWQTKNDSFEYNNQTYNVSTKVITTASTFQGFYVRTPFQLSITEGLVEFHNNPLPDNITLDIMLKFHPHVAYYDNGTIFQNFLTLQTKKKDDYNYNVITPKNGTMLYYIYSGQKSVSTILIFNGEEIKEMEKADVVEIKSNEVKAQIDMNRAVIILALWTIFTSLYRPINTLIDWIDHTLSTRWLIFDDEIN